MHKIAGRSRTYRLFCAYGTLGKKSQIAKKNGDKYENFC